MAEESGVPGGRGTSGTTERHIDSEYKIWKKNTPFLYDFVLTHSLEWPSLTVEWLPNITPIRTMTTTGGGGGGGGGTNTTHGGAGGGVGNHHHPHHDCEIHHLLLGTHTAGGEPNHLMIATAVLPRYNNPTTNHPGAVAAAGAGGGGSGGGIVASQLRYDDEKKEVGGYGLRPGNSGSASGSRIGKVEIKMKINHEGEVHRARYMPQNHFIVASRGPAPELYIWDFSKHPSFPTDYHHPTTTTTTATTGDQPPPPPPTGPGLFCPQAVCTGHTQDGFALAWSPHEEGKLISGSGDANLLLWDVRAGYNNTTTKTKKGGGPAPGPTPLSPMQTYPASTQYGHSATIEDVAWHTKDAHIIGSVSDDASICFWDIRTNYTNTKPMQRVMNAHRSDINCLAFNPVAEFTVATGGADSVIAIWDMRNLTKPIVKLEGTHTDQILKVEWAPFNESILGSGGADRRVALWDLSRIGQEQSPEDTLDGPPELLFVHGGHTARVSDFSWNAQMDWCVASIAEDNVLQIWTPVEEIYVEADDDDDEDEDDDEEEVDDDNDVPAPAQATTKSADHQPAKE